ncbi:hypothetical protein EN918_01365 [Mesorhizobium sp. M7A.F.Ca.CA.004.05.1.1]|nr:hypothetical protein EN918_01365 [Mesorhizobium sp. M7A.F.Ca.CA.004.05.1.1]
MFTRLGVAVPILSVTDDTHLTLAYAWPGATAAGAAYAIALENSNAADIVDLNRTLSRVLVTLSLVGVHPNASGTIAERDAIVLTSDDEGFFFLHAEIGIAFAFYRWSGTAWEGPFPVADAAAGGPVSSIAPGTGIAIDNTNPAIPVVKLANMANATVKGRTTAGTGAPEDLSMTQLDLLQIAAGKKRERLTASRTYFVRTDGSNGNTGLVNNAGGAFLTLQKAIDVVKTLDLGGFGVTIQVGAGTYTAGVNVNAPFVGGLVSVVGDAITPANVIISTTSSSCITVSGGGSALSVSGLKLQTTTSGQCLWATNKGQITVDGKMDFGACAGGHILADNDAAVTINANYNITGSASKHWWAEAYGLVACVGKTITITGTPAFGTQFANAFGGFINVPVNTFSGSATGSRYNAALNGTINTNNAGTSYLPGSAAGTGTNPSVTPFGLYN